jgi:hypothetical protein
MSPTTHTSARCSTQGKQSSPMSTHADLRRKRSPPKPGFILDGEIVETQDL